MNNYPQSRSEKYLKEQAYGHLGSNIEKIFDCKLLIIQLSKTELELLRQLLQDFLLQLQSL